MPKATQSVSDRGITRIQVFCFVLGSSLTLTAVTGSFLLFKYLKILELEMTLQVPPSVLLIGLLEHREVKGLNEGCTAAKLSLEPRSWNV